MTLVVSDAVTQWTVARHAPLSMGILQERILEWVAIYFSRGSSLPRDQTHISYVSCFGRQVLDLGRHHLGSPWVRSLIPVNLIRQSTL